MYEYHGWMTISENTYEEDTESLCLVIADIRVFIEELKNWIGGNLELNAVNGEFHISLSGNDNHTPIEKYNQVTIFEYIGTQAKGSYGLLYIRDAADKQSHNTFKVYVLARGILTQKEDMYLSPCNPTIED
ncbi:hypothetical protein GCM10008018_40990 [Paenibacillus marchantiophytorum]|uniref:Immunity protein 7 n=1 Tax=Paenibacillus marchantiophytorum TaxID=1619310 RepID=A0ABQ1EX93_9BACL|nr:Imm7 family immunity protein [Paenibacillus marchantiophytorum]GFZ90487.1 hypothetical protein GCM10008018_40990 [Paenibacillus marchantiophytorum]